MSHVRVVHDHLDIQGLARYLLLIHSFSKASLFITFNHLFYFVTVSSCKVLFDKKM